MATSGSISGECHRWWMDDQRARCLDRYLFDSGGHAVNFGKWVREKKRAIIDRLSRHSHGQLSAMDAQIALVVWGGWVSMGGGVVVPTGKPGT